jgi:hypothetical protein
LGSALTVHSTLPALFKVHPTRRRRRPYALTAKPPKRIPPYQDFFALWKDADPDIPILKEAKAEYAKLQ